MELSPGSPSSPLRRAESTTPSPSLPSKAPFSARPSSVDTRDQGTHIKHGLLQEYSFRAGAHLRTVIFHPETGTSILHHAKGYSVYCGSRVEEEHSDGNTGIEKLLYAKGQDLYVGVCKYHLKVSLHTVH